MRLNLSSTARPTLTAVHELSAAGRLAAWGSAALSGEVSPDEAADRVSGPADPGHRVAGLPTEDGPVTLTYAFGRLRALGATGLRLVLSRPGDPGGLPGPAAFTESAVAVGEAVLATGSAQIGLLLLDRGLWSAERVDPDPRTPMSLADAERHLGQVMREATAVLSRLDVASWDPAALDLLAGRSRIRAPSMPPSVPPEALRVLVQAMRVATIVELARANEGGAVTAAEMLARTEVLRDLDAAARRAVEAACSPA
jgi:hypothetical protein